MSRIGGKMRWDNVLSRWLGTNANEHMGNTTSAQTRCLQTRLLRVTSSLHNPNYQLINVLLFLRVPWLLIIIDKHKPCPSVYTALSSLQAWGAFIKLFISRWKSVLRLNIWHNEWFGPIKESLSALKSHTPSVTADSQKHIGIASNLTLSSSSSVFLSWFGFSSLIDVFMYHPGESQGLRCLSFMPLGDDTSVTQIT